MEPIQVPDDFDYAAFLREDAMDLGSLQLERSPSAPAVSNSPGESSSKSGTGSEVVRRPAQKPKHERRGHTKSRRGCFNCKRRRIKCQETKPSCGHCLKTGLKCEYPAFPQITHQPHHQIPLFSLQDMRFFQHFLLNCYPSVPVANESVWTHEVPCLSQQHEYLMHALLGLAASDLMQQDPTLLPFAVAHRVKAIKAIKRRLTEMSRTGEVRHDESNAMVATCFALTFQSVMLEDGMAEFMAFVRGILIVGMQMWMKGMTPIFTNMVNDDAEAVLAPFMRDLPLIRPEWSEMALVAIQNLGPLCIDDVAAEYHAILLDWVQKLFTSSFDAYKALRRHYSWWMMLPHDRFRRIIDPTNQAMVLLATHWIALKQIMAIITEAEDAARSMSPAATPAGNRRGPQGNVDQGVGRWLRYLNRQVDFEHAVYNAWPVWVGEQLDRDASFFGRMR